MAKLIKKFSNLKNKLYGKYKSLINHLNNFRTRIAIRRGKGRLLTLSTIDMFNMQVTHKELKRYDMVVRYLAVENYFGINDFGYALYKKMQDLRMGEGYGNKAIAQFKKLIQSYEKNGYDKESYITADKDLQLIDGSHRMALAMYYHIDKIRVLEINVAHPVDYSIDWFFQNGFSDEEINLILNKADELLEEANQPFSCVIWDPACDLKDDVIRDLGYFGKVGECKSYKFRPAEYQNIVRAIYAIDDIEKWKVDKKLEYMGDNACEAIELELFYDDPEYRIKGATGMPLSSYGEKVKKTIRERYKSSIDNYFFDIILHIGDSYLQSEYMHKVFEPGINFREVLNILSPYQYALTKIDVPYMPEEFPDRIPVGKDVDILCNSDSFEEIKKQLIEYAKKYQEYEIVLDDSDSSDVIRIRFELSGKLIFQIDCRSKYESIPDKFLELALLLRHEKDGYFVLDTGFEAIIRRIAYASNPSHEYHREYYEKYKSEECIDLFEKYMGGGINENLIIEYKEYLDNSGIPTEQVCIVGSFTLDVLGIRASRDIDFVVSSEYADQYPEGVTKVTQSGNIEKVRKNWCRDNHRVIFTDDEIIENPGLHFYYKNLKIIKFPLLIYKKCVLKRDKDIEDLKLIQNYMTTIMEDQE